MNVFPLYIYFFFKATLRKRLKDRQSTWGFPEYLNTIFK